MQFRKNKKIIKALISSDSKINMITVAYASKLGLKTWETDVKPQKIDSLSFKTFKLVIAAF